MIRIERFLINCLCLTILACAWPLMTLAGAINLPQTGQTTCYDMDGNVIACAGTGQDGDVQAGVPWPEPRFTDNGDGTVTDHLTGLIWLKNANCFGTHFWDDAVTYSNSLSSGSCGLTDGSSAGKWRLPNIVELESLVNAGVVNCAKWLNAIGFTGVQPFNHWSASTYTGHSRLSLQVAMSSGSVYYNNKDDDVGEVWPVRGGPVPQTWRTGQTTCYDGGGNIIDCAGTGQDGDVQAGVAWPEPRFIDNGDGTVTDHLTGLIWLKDANCFGARTWFKALSDSNTLATGACGLTDSSLTGDWRLPNRKELFSLIDYSQYNPALPLGHPFANVQSPRYWSASTRAANTSDAWTLYMDSGLLHSSPKISSHYVWPVRGGQGGDWECVSDLDGDGDVDGFDLMLFMHAYNDMSTDADISGDGLINSQDLAIFAAEFGQGSCDPDGG